MTTGRDTTPDSSAAVGSGRFLWRRLLLCLTVSPALGAGAAWAAVVAQEKFAPLVIFPLVVGVGLGAMVVALIRLSHAAHRPTVLLATVLAVALAVVGQHYLAYRAHRQRFEQDTARLQRIRAEYPQLPSRRQPTSPPSFLTFLSAQAQRGRDMQLGGLVARGWAAWVSWAVDALLVLLAALALVVPALWLPFCNRCKSWYRVTRSARLDGEAVQRLATLVPVRRNGQSLVSVRCRLLDCSQRCGLTSCESAWRTSEGDTVSMQTWLDDEGRERVTRVFDEVRDQSRNR
jgi:hypothetical protein